MGKDLQLTVGERYSIISYVLSPYSSQPVGVFLRTIGDVSGGSCDRTIASPAGMPHSLRFLPYISGHALVII